MRATLIIGAGYGDEGKGLATDWVCAKELAAGRRPLVVRANGGTQAAHTVVTPQGDRHVFHSYGSGSLQDVPTYYGPEFLFNPIGFRVEAEELPVLGYAEVYAHPEAVISLPVDMMINQIMEERRAGNRHGSCGWGIGETVERSSHGGWRLTMAEMGGLDPTLVAAISDDYASMRWHKLGVDPYSIPAEWQEHLQRNEVIYKFVEDCAAAAKRITLADHSTLPVLADSLIFEGAQGLGLDQAGAHFPHVTRSNTGCANPLALLARLGEEQVEVIDVLYVTRCYATRHGAGPLEHEGEQHGCVVSDPTNVENQWQGSLRTAPLDSELTTRLVARDLQQLLIAYPAAHFNMLMTCTDQAGPDYTFIGTEGPVRAPLNKPSHALGRIMSGARQLCYRAGYDTKGMRALLSSGPTRQDVTVLHTHPGSFTEYVAEMRGTQHSPQL
jgi:adenylosuccinate synthase